MEIISLLLQMLGWKDTERQKRENSYTMGKWEANGINAHLSDPKHQACVLLSMVSVALPSGGAITIMMPTGRP